MNEENQTIIKALNMFGRVPEQYELLNEIERLNNIINEYENMKKELLDYIYHNEYCRFGHIDGGEADEMRNILNRTDKLKALKESGNNDSIINNSNSNIYSD